MAALSPTNPVDGITGLAIGTQIVNFQSTPVLPSEVKTASPVPSAFSLINTTTGQTI